MKTSLFRNVISIVILSFCVLFVASAAIAQDGQDQSTTQVQPDGGQQEDSRVQPVNPADDSTGGADSQASDQPVLPSGIRLGPNYVIGPEDILNIDVFEVPELSKMTVQVANDGTIALPLLGRVKAAGLTGEQLREELAQDWGKDYLQNPQITLLVSKSYAHPVTVLGAVEKPGVIQLTGRRTLLEVLALAGGLAKKGTGSPGRTVYIERPGGFQSLHPADGMNFTAANPDKIGIDLQKLLYSQDTALNIDVRPFDVITVSKAGLVYVIGAVTKPGAFVLEDKDTVTALEALAMAQGFSGTAYKGKAKVIHRSDSGAMSESSVDLVKIMKGKADDVNLAANDVLFIPGSTGKAVGQRGMESAIGVISGLLIWGRL